MKTRRDVIRKFQSLVGEEITVYPDRHEHAIGVFRPKNSGLFFRIYIPMKQTRKVVKCTDSGKVFMEILKEEPVSSESMYMQIRKWFFMHVILRLDFVNNEAREDFINDFLYQLENGTVLYNNTNSMVECEIPQFDKIVPVIEVLDDNKLLIYRNKYVLGGNNNE